MKEEDLLTAIVRGEYDNQIEAIWSALQERQKIVRQIKRATALHSVKVGDKVQTKDIRPKVLVGLIGTIQSIRGTRFMIKLSDEKKLLPWDASRYAPGGMINVPATCVEKVA